MGLEIDLFCITPDEEVFSNVRENSASCARWAKRVDAHKGSAVIVGGAPSLRTRISSIKFRHDQGQTVFALNGACRFLNENGIIPDYQVILDPQPFLPSYIGEAKEYLLASQCHPDTFSAISSPTLWHFAMEGVEEHIPPHDESYCLIGGGYTSLLCSMCLTYAMGYRKLHLYGCDSSVTDGGDHAYPHPELGLAFEIAPIATATIGGKKFKTTLSMAGQASAFPKLANDLIDAGCLITTDCDGLLKAVVDEMRIQPAAKAA